MRRCLFLFLFVQLSLLNGQEWIYESDELKIQSVSEGTFRHVSYLETLEYGLVACNGMLVIDSSESAVFDTPINNEVSKELIKWLVDSMNTTIKVLVVNHHHIDCLGGLEAFKDQEIPSIASGIAQRLARDKGNPVPRYSFESEENFKVGELSVINKRFGPAHSQGAIVSYVKEENVLFGGCSVKSLKAGKGNLADADTIKWSSTIQQVKDAFPDLVKVIPGHGKVGGKELLDYTIQMFQEK